MRMTQKEMVDLAVARFGRDAMKWQFVCFHCGDVATPKDFQDAGADPGKIGQECIGRSLGALANPSWKGRGCDFAAYGLIPGPWEIEMPDGHVTYSFKLAEAASE